jgi:hypothetical protein
MSWNQSKSLRAVRRKTRRRVPRKQCENRNVAARLWLRIQKHSSWSASSPSATCVAAWRLRTGALRKFTLKRSCAPRLRVVARMSQLKKCGENSTSIARRACPLWTRRGAAAAPSAPTAWRSRRAPDEEIEKFEEPLNKLMETLAETSPIGLTREQSSNRMRS